VTFPVLLVTTSLAPALVLTSLASTPGAGITQSVPRGHVKKSFTAVGTGGAGPVMDSTMLRVLSDVRSVIVTGKETLPANELRRE
jgi:hypothetical protein